MKNWRKGALHCHSLWSDGRALPEMILHTYKKLGYNFVCIADHNVFQLDKQLWLPVMPDEGPWPSSLCKAEYERTISALPDMLDEKDVGFRKYVRLKTFDELQQTFEIPEEFVLIPGEEVTIIDSDYGENSEKTYHLHINLLNQSQTVAPPSDGDATALTRQVFESAQKQALIMINHPFWQVWDVPPELLIDMPELKLFEICNSGTAAMVDGWIFTQEKFWDFVLAHRLDRGYDVIYGTASDDAHYYNDERLNVPCGCNTAWVMLNCQGELNPENINKSLANGDFYSTCGVLLEDVTFDRESNTLSVKVLPEDNVDYRIDFIATGKNFDRTIEYADYPAKVEKRNRRRPLIPDSIGKVVKSVNGTSGSYTLSSDDLYVRAVVYSNISTKMQNAFYPAKQCAWVQPVKNCK